MNQVELLISEALRICMQDLKSYHQDSEARFVCYVRHIDVGE